MYIGDTGVKGLHHLVYELVANSVDEALAGFCRHINVRISVDGSLSVADDGRGIPVDEHPKEKRPTLEVVMTIGRRRRQVRQGHLQGVGRPARHGRQGGDGPERVDRGPGAAQRPHLHAGVRARQGRQPRARHRRLEAHRHPRHVQARPRNLPRGHVRLRHAGGPAARAGLPQQGADADAARRAHRQGGGVQVRRRPGRVRQVHQPHGRAASSADPHREDRGPGRGGDRHAVHARARRSATAATRTTPSTRSAART